MSQQPSFLEFPSTRQRLNCRNSLDESIPAKSKTMQMLGYFEEKAKKPVDCGDLKPGDLYQMKIILSHDILYLISALCRILLLFTD